MTSEVEAIQEMNNTFKEALAKMKFTQTLEFAKDLTDECMDIESIWLLWP